MFFRTPRIFSKKSKKNDGIYNTNSQDNINISEDSSTTSEERLLTNEEIDLFAKQLSRARFSPELNKSLSQEFPPLSPKCSPKNSPKTIKQDVNDASDFPPIKRSAGC